MTTATFDDFRDFSREIKAQQRTLLPSKYLLLQKNLEEHTQCIVENWHNFSPEIKNGLKELAYDLLEPNCNFFERITSIVNLFLVKITKKEEEVSRCVKALDTFIDTILHLVEQDEFKKYDILNTLFEEAKVSFAAGNYLNGKSCRSEQLQ
jgi:hypothetical protein